MADKTPLKARYTGSDATALGELESGDTINQSFLDAVVVRKNAATTMTAQMTPMNGALTDASTVAWDASSNGQVVTLTLTAARTMGAPTNVVQNALYVLVLTTGGYTPSWNAAYKWPSGGTPSSLSSGVYVFTFVGGSSSTLIPTGPGYLTGA